MCVCVCVCVCVCLRYSTSNNVVTLKWGQRSLKVYYFYLLLLYAVTHAPFHAPVLRPTGRVVGLESWTWTQVGLESDFLRTWTGLGLEGQGLGLGLGLEG